MLLDALPQQREHGIGEPAVAALQLHGLQALTEGERGACGQNLGSACAVYGVWCTHVGLFPVVYGGSSGCGLTASDHMYTLLYGRCQALDRSERASRLEPAVRQAVGRSGLRTVADAIGVSHGTLHTWLEKGGTPSKTTLTKTERWEQRKEGGGPATDPAPRDSFYNELAAILRDQSTTLLEKRAALLDLALLFRAEAMGVQERVAAEQMDAIRRAQRLAQPTPPDAAEPVDRPGQVGSNSSSVDQTDSDTSGSDSKG